MRRTDRSFRAAIDRGVAMTTPFLRWAGGKRSLLEQLRPLLPSDIGERHYVEPFLGGGALFFDVRPSSSSLCDANRDLIETYRAVRDVPDKVIGCLEGLSHGHERDPYWYELVRNNFNKHVDLEKCAPSEQAAVRAAWFIYLNRACFNGLWRVSKAGEFNVPSGRKVRVEARPVGLRECSAALQSAELHCADFSALACHEHVRKFVYFDPPYLDTFSDYAKGGFVKRDHERLREHFALLDRRGARCMLSHTDTPWIRELYAGYNITTVSTRNAVGAKAGTRTARNEVVIRNYA